jgi:aryl-alcohol dehydrogenase-like predicted oxidoreductase
MRRLGRSGLLVTEVGLGCNNFGMRIAQAEADTVVDAAIDLGINFFDTADMYGGEQSEVMLGKALGKRRPQHIVATKFGMPMGKDPLTKGASRRWIMQAVEGSLKRLGTDYIDLYQQHLADPLTPIEETLRALDDLVTQGKVRYIGNSNFTAWQVADADWAARSESRARFISAQNRLSLIEQGALAELVPACEHLELGVLPFFPLASGLLSGKYHRGQPLPPDTRFAALGASFIGGLSDAKFDIVEKLEGWAKARGHSLLELAFAWLLGHPIVGSVIAGATKPEQVRANVAAAEWTLTPDEVSEVGQLAKG